MFRFCYRVEEDQIHILDFKTDDEYQIFRFVFLMPNLKPNSFFPDRFLPRIQIIPVNRLKASGSNSSRKFSSFPDDSEAFFNPFLDKSFNSKSSKLKA